MKDIFAGLRALGRRPASSLVVVATLALGIGANTAIFSLLNAIALRPLPVPDADQLAAIATTIPDSVNGDQPLSLPMFSEIARLQPGLSSVFAWNGGAISNFEANGRTLPAALAAVSGEYYAAMRIAPLLGRFIGPQDVSLGAGPSNAVAVISYRAWRNWYLGDPHILGRTLRIETHPFTIIGVEPEGFSGLIIDGATDVTIPLLSPGQNGMRDPHDARLLWLRVYGRLRPGLTLAQARTMLDTAWPHIQYATKPPGYEGERSARFFARRIVMTSAASGVSFLRQRFSSPLRVLLGLVGAVLLIACLNLANLSMARATRQHHESGVRAALGADTWDLMRQPLIESLLLSFAGALFGLGLAYGMSRALLRIAWTGIVTTPLSTSPDARVLVFTATVAAVAGLLFALAPAWLAARTDPIDALKRQSRSVAGGFRVFGRTFLLAQISLSLMLVAAAFLFTQTLRALHTADAGYRRDHLLTMLLFPKAGKIRQNSVAAYYRELADRLRRLPGVSGVSFSNNAPANEFEDFDPVEIAPGKKSVQAIGDYVGPDFFRVAGMHVLSGREFDWRDAEQDENIVMLSCSLADKLFGHSDPVGREMFLGPIAYRIQATVVGVVNNASLWKIESRQPMAYFRPITKTWVDGDPLVVIRTSADPNALKTSAEQTVRALGRHYALRTMTVEERLDSYITAQRLTAMLATFFGVVALLIAAIGIYGLMSYQVARRTAELGIRMALGAQRWQIFWLILRDSLLLVIIGCLVGTAASLAMGRLIKNLLFGISASDPATFWCALLCLIVVALFASSLPARKAAVMDPMAALRVE